MIYSFAQACNKKDGKDFINIYSGGKTKLGKLLSNFAHTPLVYNGKQFESVEGYWYYKVSKGDVKFQFLYGLEAKERGKLIKDRGPAPTREELKEVYIAKLNRNPDIKKMLLDCDLPFAHFYMGSKGPINADKFLWTIELWDELRNELKNTKPNKYEKIFGSWYHIMRPFIDSPDFKKIGDYLKQQEKDGIIIYPGFGDIFRAFKECPYDELKVVILTTNAYVYGEMDGLAFSVCQEKDAADTPPVLKRIHDAVEKDCYDGLNLNPDFDLSYWAKQGVLLLNCDLTTERGKAGSHLDLWRPMIKYLMVVLAEFKHGIIYYLIGKEAHKYLENIQSSFNDSYLIEHPMNAIKNRREWNHQEMFKTINRVSKFINEKEIQWM